MGQRFRFDPEAERQVYEVSNLKGVSSVIAFPNIRIAKSGLAGVAIESDRIYPGLVGEDVGCGMSLFMLDLQARKVDSQLFLSRMRKLREPWIADASRMMEEAGLPAELHRAALGTLGGGDHFCEIQSFGTAADGWSLPTLPRDTAYLLVHSGSRSLGATIASLARHPSPDGLEPGSDDEVSYLAIHDVAVRWASINRKAIALRVASLMGVELHLACDVPHNLVERREGKWLHRKGTARAEGGVVPVAGFRNSPSYLVTPSARIGDFGHSLPPSAASRYQTVDQLDSGQDGKGHLELTGGAGSSVAEIQRFDVATPLASFRPLATFKEYAAQR